MAYPRFQTLKDALNEFEDGHAYEEVSIAVRAALGLHTPTPRHLTEALVLFLSFNPEATDKSLSLTVTDGIVLPHEIIEAKYLAGDPRSRGAIAQHTRDTLGAQPGRPEFRTVFILLAQDPRGVTTVKACPVIYEDLRKSRDPKGSTSSTKECVPLQPSLANPADLSCLALVIHS